MWTRGTQPVHSRSKERSTLLMPHRQNLQVRFIFLSLNWNWWWAFWQLSSLVCWIYVRNCLCTNYSRQENLKEIIIFALVICIMYRQLWWSHVQQAGKPGFHLWETARRQHQLYTTHHSASLEQKTTNKASKCRPVTIQKGDYKSKVSLNNWVRPVSKSKSPAGNAAVVEHVPSMHKALGLINPQYQQQHKNRLSTPGYPRVSLLPSILVI